MRASPLRLPGTLANEMPGVVRVGICVPLTGSRILESQYALSLLSFKFGLPFQGPVLQLRGDLPKTAT